MLASLARALRLTTDERDHLFVLAGHPPPTLHTDPGHVSPSLLHLLDQLPGTPAQVLNDLGDVLVQDALAEALSSGGVFGHEHGRNVVWRWFTQPSVRTAFPSEEHDH